MRTRFRSQRPAPAPREAPARLPQAPPASRARFPGWAGWILLVLAGVAVLLLPGDLSGTRLLLLAVAALALAALAVFRRRRAR